MQQEEQHLQVARVFFERTNQYLNAHVQGGVAELFFNLDEIDLLNWEDQKRRQLLSLP
jgi:hypothetical protein